MNYKKYISTYTYNYIFICIGILLLFVMINFLFKKDNNENFNSISEYPKKFIEDDCKIYLESDLKGKEPDFCKNSAFVKNGKLLKNLCDVNGTFQILELENDKDKKQFFGCDANQNNLLGLKWENPNLENIPHKLYSVPAIFYNLYFNNDPYKGTWNLQPSIGQINLDGSNFLNIPSKTKLGTLSSMNIINNQNYSISFWMYALNIDKQINILQIGDSECKLKVNGGCKKYGKKNWLGVFTSFGNGWWNNWFNSDRDGGPAPGQYETCNNRKNYWQDICSQKQNWAEKLWNPSPFDNTTTSMIYKQGNISINLGKNNLEVLAQANNNNIARQVWSAQQIMDKNLWYSLNHVIINFQSNKITTYVNGELVSTLNSNILPTPKNANIYLSNGFTNTGVNIKNMIFWNTNFNEKYANDLYQSYLPIIREPNKIKLMGKEKKNKEESFKAPFKLNKRFTLGLYTDLNLISNISITISFTINVKKNYSNWVNIMLITGNNFDWNWRNPGIWLVPNECALHVRRSTEYYWNEGIDSVPFEMNQDVYFKIVFDASSRKIIVYKNKNWKSPIIHQCTGNFYNITKDYRVWLAANSFGENVEISNFEIEGDVFTP